VPDLITYGTLIKGALGGWDLLGHGGQMADGCSYATRLACGRPKKAIEKCREVGVEILRYAKKSSKKSWLRSGA